MKSETLPGFARLHDVLTRIHADGEVDSVLRAIADGVVDVSGFAASTINVYWPEADEFELVAVAGDEPTFDANLHRRYPAATILERNRLGEQWGLFRFISHRLELDAPDGFMVIPQESRDEPGAWHSLDELSVELRSPVGDLLGIMYVDRPADGMLPGDDTLAAMEVYAVAAGIAIHNAQQRSAEHEEAWLGGMVRSVVDHLAGGGELPAKLERVMDQLRTELRAPLSWLDVFDGVAVPGVPPPADQPAYTLVAAIDSYGRDLARSATETGQAVVLDPGRLGRPHPLLTDPQRAWLNRALDADGVTSVALAPLDNDEELAGQLVLGRRSGRPWSTGELATLREIGRELGWALGRERSRERERYAEEELARSARERRDLLNALAREITPHFTSVDAHMTSLPPDHPARVSMEAFWTLFDRVSTQVAFEGPDHRPRRTAIDMTATLDTIWSPLVDLGRRRQVQVLPVERHTAQVAWADPEELEWIVNLLAEDVVLQAPPGSAVRFGLVTLNGRLVLSCQASGLGGEAGPGVDTGSDDDPDVDVTDPDDVDDLDDTDDDPDDVDFDVVSERRRRTLDDTLEPVSPAARTARGTGVPSRSDHTRTPWWHAGAKQLLARSDGRLTTREGPMGRRVVSLSLPSSHPPA